MDEIVKMLDIVWVNTDNDYWHNFYWRSDTMFECGSNINPCNWFRWCSISVDDTCVFISQHISKYSQRKNKKEIGFWEFPYCKIIGVSIVSHIIERVLGDMFIAVTLVTHMCTPVILILLVIYPESTKDITSIKKLLIKGIKATFEKHFLTVIIACVFDFISAACLFFAIPVVGFRLPIVGIMEPISKLFLIPTIYFTILSSVYIMTKIVEYEENENSLSFENVDRWRT